MSNIEKIFFDEIVKEAETGSVNCGFILPLCFSTRELVGNNYVDLTTAKEFDDTLMPTLLIKDRARLISKIEEYIEASSEFYCDDVNLKIIPNKEKYLIARVLSNALSTDFNDIAELFDRHTQFIKNNCFDNYFVPQNIGYCDKLKSHIIVEVSKQDISNETPYALKSLLIDDDYNVLYRFPNVSFGIANGKAYIYSVQGTKEDKNKKVERLLRKVDAGFSIGDEARDSIMNPENLSSVSPWALVSLTIALPIIKNSSEIDYFLAPSFLVNRWNGAEVSFSNFKSSHEEVEASSMIREMFLKKEKEHSEHDDIQRNITDKFLRNFRRLEHQSDKIKILDMPYEVDSCLRFKVDDNCSFNNVLLDDIYKMADLYSTKSKSGKNK